MGVDLTLLPLLNKDFWAAHDMLQLNRRSELWPEFRGMKKSPIPKPLSCHLASGEDGESRYGELEDDPYGDRLAWVTVRDLLPLREHEAIKDDWQNRAVWAYLAEMPEDWQIVLYWH